MMNDDEFQMLGALIGAPDTGAEALEAWVPKLAAALEAARSAVPTAEAAIDPFAPADAKAAARARDAAEAARFEVRRLEAATARLDAAIEAAKEREAASRLHDQLARQAAKVTELEKQWPGIAKAAHQIAQFAEAVQAAEVGRNAITRRHEDVEVAVVSPTISRFVGEIFMPDPAAPSASLFKGSARHADDYYFGMMQAQAALAINPPTPPRPPAFDPAAAARTGVESSF